MNKKDILRFWSHVAVAGEDACWLWQASVDGGGYGVVSIGNVSFQAHIIAFTLANGPTPLNVLHTCDVRRCCNPRHLYAGTQMDNVNDMCARGRRRGPEDQVSRAPTKAR
jgi:hypothetical protein